MLELLEYRHATIDGVEQNWMWPKADTVAWANPIRDWVGPHKTNWLDNVPGRAVAVQAGGNCGLYPRLLAQYFSRVYTFEPDPLNFMCLVNNCQRDNIVKIQSAVGKCNELIHVNHLSETNVGMHTVSAGGTIPTMTIDSLALEACDFIQLDVEGYEVNALLGALGTIKRFHPVISVELGRGESPHSMLSSLGYQFIVRSEDDAIYKYKG